MALKLSLTMLHNLSWFSPKSNTTLELCELKADGVALTTSSTISFIFSLDTLDSLSIE
ncbi:hypothetical protein D3C71_1761530 [compost metagenome]